VTEQDVELHERVAVLEIELADVKQDLADRRDRDRWVIGTLIAIATVLVAVVAPFIVMKGGP
jgi:hypothetical protein